ncbi:MAG: class I SAM-dependent methyltransferase [Methanomicrobiaceae archaeon]|uniref:Methyltransferase type 12 n=1 Tax=hydrocarbon metagenome TaxID=938273 RepID=A0A0W8FHJ7_9ZZZZ|nr:class I SAM-dependent methyltransferase [Methanomicrobiaceae archaeon]MDD5418789.1 class I SAM-dependent methyltransferase [Methanomicrobiaceae archaeon]
MKAKEHFNDKADRYEALIQKIIPEACLFFGTAVDHVPAEPASILELGSGTGFVTEQILARCPEAEITCIDMTPEMLAVARAKPALSAVRFIEGDFRDVWPEERFDVVFSTLCLHHLTDADRTAVIRRIRATLNEEGRFINGDVFKPESDWEEALYRDRWRRHMAESGVFEAEAEGMIEKRHNSFGFLDTFGKYREKLIDAGFQQIFCPYTYEFYGIFVALR